MSAALRAGAVGAHVLSPATGVTYARAMHATVDDSELMLRYRAGDVAAFETLYRRHNDALYRYLLRLSRNPETAADVFQDVWSNIIRSRRRYQATARFNTFLYRVARNCFIDHVRRNKRHYTAGDTDPDLVAHPQDTPDTCAEKSLARERMLTALGSLPSEQRDAFLLHEEVGLTIDSIAEITGVNRETAKSRLRYATRKLKAALKDGNGRRDGTS